MSTLLFLTNLYPTKLFKETLELIFTPFLFSIPLLETGKARKRKHHTSADTFLAFGDDIACSLMQFGGFEL